MGSSAPPHDEDRGKVAKQPNSAGEQRGWSETNSTTPSQQELAPWGGWAARPPHMMRTVGRLQSNQTARANNVAGRRPTAPRRASRNSHRGGDGQLGPPT